MTFDDLFKSATGWPKPMQWQRDLATNGDCSNRMIRIPTGFGKTFGVLTTWMWHRLARQDESWPRRIVWCLPMRVLVEQTRDEVERALDALGLLWNGTEDHAGKVGVHLLMGGANSGEWHLYPEESAVLIGTQDMLLSRAINRGYGSPRARWPMEFGLLSQDCLWVMDEVQLMDVGLATSGQLQAFRENDRAAHRSLRPCFTWWMSATLQQDWLAKSPETAGMAQTLPQIAVPPTERSGELWEQVKKPCERIEPKTEKALAHLVAEAHLAAGRGATGPTLVVVNTVERAIRIFDALGTDKSLNGTDLCLVHSRFRPWERAAWRARFLNRDACAPGTDRIVIATQVVEAGVDFSAGLLVTELAPWPSLVQRFGRCARWGGMARVLIADFSFKGAKALPYTEDELDAARRALDFLPDVSPASLEAFEEERPDLLPELYPYDPKHLLLRHELEEMFDTTPDLTGADIDISRFIRSGEERDISVFWMEVPKDANPDPGLRPSREALCAVPFLKAREWLCKDKSDGLKPDKHAWVWNWLDGVWRRAERRDLYPGQTILVEASCGGYLVDRGWAADSNRPVTVLPSDVVDLAPDEQADAAQDDETLSMAERWQTIATHGLQVGALARTLAPVEFAYILDLAGRWHDTGKVHPAFDLSISSPDRPNRHDLAKAPKDAWLKGKRLYPMPDGSRRPGFRHELASTLALFGVLRRHNPDNHPALLGPWREWLEASGLDTPQPLSQDPPSPIEQEILALDAEHFDLLAYLVCAHHGKVRLAWHPCPADQKPSTGHLPARGQDVQPRIRGIVDGETLPAVTLADGNGSLHILPETRLELAPAAAGLNPVTGVGWTERVLGLLARHGPFTLAWLEALLRAADQRASRRPITDPLLNPSGTTYELETSDTNLAPAHPGATLPAAPGGHSAARSPIHGDGGGAGGGDVRSGATRPPSGATRYLETTLGILSYRQLAPHLAERVAAVELAIGRREYAASTSSEDLILDLHRRICADLTPNMAGRWRRKEVRVGEHAPPPAGQLPMLMRDYAADLAARLGHASALSDEALVELLAHAEGRLLHIHPFEDFNGRVTRLFLLELLYRLDLPIVTLGTEPGPETERYFSALRAFDAHDPRPLEAIWRSRFEKGD